METLLDLSKLALLLVVKGDAQTTPKADACLDSRRSDELITPQPSRHTLPMDEVATYLRLRAEHLVGFAGHITARLLVFHEQLDSDEGLADDSRLYVERLLAKAKSENTIYSLSNVERCFGAVYWLRVAIDNTKPDRREFLECMLKGLYENWRLTFGQIQAINRWGEGVRKAVPAFPVLEASAFSGVQAPKFKSA
ncbi:hypothetical protein ACI77O_13025 [Pseudomonas tritici]|uniref:hypothetical protein n=1 Tax=Pseudomonas tritici TaxID=2745518 RepID=UPI00387AEA61